MSYRILIIDTYYPQFLDDWYKATPNLNSLSFEEQRRALFSTAFGVFDAYPHYLSRLGCAAEGIVCNADILQERWATEHGLVLSGNIHERRRQIVAAQIRSARPDVLYVFEWCPLGDTFLSEMRTHVKLIVGQIASPLPPSRSFRGYDLMISSWPPIVEYFRREGIRGEPLRLGFDPRILEKSRRKDVHYDTTFVGGFADSHPDRIAWLERLLKDVNVNIFGYGLDRVPPDSPLHQHHHGPVWGHEMYGVLQGTSLTLNRHAHIDVRGSVETGLATNMRLYEATGVGALLLTDAKKNLNEMFEPGKEVVAYTGDQDCIDKISYYLEHSAERMEIAEAGQKRTLRDHGYDQRMAELLSILNAHL